MPGGSSASLSLLLLALLGGHAVVAQEAAPVARRVVGLVPTGVAGVDLDLQAGLVLALEPAPQGASPPAPPAFVVRVGAHAPRWGSAAESAVDLVRRDGACVLVGPPERATGHLLAQVGTRMRVPVLSTSGCASVGASGSRWLARVVLPDEGADAAVSQPFVARSPEGERFVADYGARFGRPPTRAAAAGFDAGQVLRRALERSAGRVGPDLKAALAGLTAIPGAQGAFALSDAGQRPAAAPPLPPR